jgi:hypothetical protein
LNNQGGVPVLLKFQGMNRKEVSKALKIVNQHQSKLLHKWQSIHGDLE